MKPNININLDWLVTEGRLLAVDPGKSTGWAVIDCGHELVRRHGLIKDIYKRDALIQLVYAIAESDVLVIEDQYLDRKKKNGRKVENVQALITLAAIRGGIEMLWSREKGLAIGENVILVKPTEWQAALNLSSRAGRDSRKHAAAKQAEHLTRLTDLSQHEVDVICMGLAIARKLKSGQLLKRAAGV
jgi:hypothetical protein